MSRLIEFWYTDLQTGRRECIFVNPVSQGKKLFKNEKYKEGILDVRPIDADGDFIGGSEYWYSLNNNGKIKKS